MTDQPLDATQLIIEEATAWVARLRADDASDEDRTAFAAWLARDRRHREEFDTLLEVWRLAGPIARAAPATVPGRTVPRSQMRVALPVAMAAAVLISALTWLVFPSAERFTTPVGGVADFRLEDDTRLHLNTHTAVRVAYSARARTIELDRGELYVEVAPDAARPLSVVTRYGQATATGTAFAVRDTGSRALVTVTEGRVSVRSPAGATHALAPGEQAELGSAEVITRVVDGVAATSWRDGTLVYDGVRLSDLIEDLNRYLPRRMTIADPQLGDLRVSAVLVIADQEQMLEALSRSLPLRWTVVSESLIILHAA